MCPLEVRKYLQMASRQEAGFTLKTSCSAPPATQACCARALAHIKSRGSRGPGPLLLPLGTCPLQRNRTGRKALPHAALESFGRDVILYNLLWSKGRLLQDHRPGWGGSKGGRRTCQCQSEIITEYLKHKKCTL